MRILITNDDGINAPGLAILERIARNLGHDTHQQKELCYLRLNLRAQRPTEHRERDDAHLAGHDCASGRPG